MLDKSQLCFHHMFKVQYLKEQIQAKLFSVKTGLFRVFKKAATAPMMIPKKISFENMPVPELFSIGIEEAVTSSSSPVANGSADSVRP